MKISVVIPTFNESKTISNLIYSLINQTLPPNEIIIVDGFSNDNTIEEVNKISKKYKYVKVLQRKNNCRGSGRNTGIKNAKNNYIALIDAGCTVDKNWLEYLSKKINSDVVFGSVEPITKNDLDLSYKAILLNKQNNEELIYPSVCSLLINQKIAKNISFLESLNGDYVVEDLNYINKLIKSSYKISYENKAKVKWQIDSSNYKIFKRYKEYSYGALNTEYKYVWYKGFIRNIIFAFIIIYLSISYSYYFLLILLILIFLRSYQYLRYLKIFKIQNIIKISKLLIINVLQLLIIDYASFISLFKKIKLSIFANFKKISLFII